LDLLAGVRRTVQDFGLLPIGCQVVVGVSGGPDSVCLLHVLRSLQDGFDLGIQVAHLHHGSRGADADADAEFVLRLASSWGLAAVVERMNIPDFARDNAIAFEEAARQQRYSFLARVADAIGASRIAVGHNADDQAETVLMHLLRGTGLSGLRGMLPLTPLSGVRVLGTVPLVAGRHHLEAEPRAKGRRCSSRPQVDPAVVRPLLAISRAEIERYRRANCLQSRFDRSNLDTTFYRNRLRHELLPELVRYNPRIRERLCHTASVVAAEHELLETLADQAWESIARGKRSGGSLVLDRAAWSALPTALQRSTLRRAVFELRPGLRDLGFVHIEDARRLALAGSVGAAATLPAGVVVVVGYETLTVGERGGIRPDFAHRPYVIHSGGVEVEVPGHTVMPGVPWTLVASLRDRWDIRAIRANRDRWTAYFDLERLAQPVLIRSRQPGDVFRPRGLGGHRTKVSSLMINRKIPREVRDNVPLLTAGDRIVWICGYHAAEGAGVHEGTRRVARLRFQRHPSDDVEAIGRAPVDERC